jgi:hypothetical protein
MNCVIDDYVYETSSFCCHDGQPTYHIDKQGFKL